MNLIKTTYCTVFLLFLGINFTTAQSDQLPDPLYTSTSNYFLDASSDWSFFFDDEQQICYIDFEEINVTVSTIKVVNEKGEILLSDDVTSLPVNSIYELDCKTYESGVYTVELHAYNGVIRKEIQL